MKYVNTEEEKAKRFQQGLEPWIRDRVAMFELDTYVCIGVREEVYGAVHVCDEIYQH